MSNPTKGRSALACQLQQEGTIRSFQALCDAIDGLGESEIHELEEELSFYTETGLIGVQMSRLMPIISKKLAIVAA